VASSLRRYYAVPSRISATIRSWPGQSRRYSRYAIRGDLSEGASLGQFALKSWLACLLSCRDGRPFLVAWESSRPKWVALTTARS